MTFDKKQQELNNDVEKRLKKVEDAVKREDSAAKRPNETPSAPQPAAKKQKRSDAADACKTRDISLP